MRIGLLALACFSALLAAPDARAQAGPGGTAALREYYSGNGLLNRGMYALAIDEYRSFLDKHPNHDKAPVARYGLIVSLYRLERYGEVVPEFDDLEIAPEFQFAAEALVILGQSRLALGSPRQAAQAFERVLRDHGDSDLADEAAALQAESLYESGAFADVEQPCRLMRSQWPQSPQRPRAELFCGLAEMARGRYAAAARRFEELNERFPDNDHAERASLLLAQCRHRTGAWEQAAVLYRSVMKGGDDRLVPEATYGLAVVEHHDGRLAGAGRLLDRLLDRYPDHELAEAAHLTRGRVWFDAGEYDRAFGTFSELAETEGAYRDDAVYWMAKIKLRQGDSKGAAQRLQGALQRFPDSELAPPMTYDRAVALSRSGDHEGALETLIEFRLKFADHQLTAEAMHLIASTLHRLERYADSLDSCRAFRRRFPDHELDADVAFVEAENSFLTDRHEQAAASYRALLDEYPRHPQAEQARFRLGLCLYTLGDFDGALPLLSGVTRGRDTSPEFRAALLAVGDAHFQDGQWDRAEQNLSAYLAFGLDQPSAGDALLKLGLARRRQGDLAGALRCFEQLIAQTGPGPQRLHADFERGLILVEMDRQADATAAFVSVVAAGPESPFAGHALNHLGAIARRSGDHEEAAARFGSAAAAFAAGGQADLCAESLFQQGQSLLAAQQFGSAAAVLAALADDHPAHVRVGHASALAAIALAREGGKPGYERALSAIGRVEAGYGQDLDPSLQAALLYEKAWCLRELDRAQEATEAYRDMIKLVERGGSAAPYGHALLELAELEVEAGRYAEAAELLRRLQQADETPELQSKGTYTLGVCTYHLDDLKSAAGLLESYLAGDPDPALVVSASVLCAEALKRTGRHQRAAEHLARVVDGHPNDAAWGPSLLRLGECHAALQQWPQSERTFRTYIEHFPESDHWYQARFGIGWAFENQGRTREALDEYRRVVERYQGPTGARAQFQIGECLFAEKRYDEAVGELLKVDILYAYPQWSAAALYEAGRCFEQMGSPVEARKQFEMVREDHPESRWAELASARLDELASRVLPGR